MINSTQFASRFAAADPRLAQAGTLYTKITNKLTPAARQKLAQAAAQLARDQRLNPSFTGPQLQTRVKNAVTSQTGILGGGGIPAGADIEELAFVVLMQAANDQDNDLQEIMNQVQAQTAAKQFLRQQMQIVNNDVANNSAQQTREQKNSALYREALSSFVARLIHHK
jgi:hypothetical protein